MAADRHSSSTTIASPDEDNLFVDLLHEAPLYGHRRPTSILGSVCYCILLAGYAIFAAGATLFFYPQKALLTPLLCSSDAILLVVTGIFQQYFVFQVQKIRLQGYYVFSQKLKHIIRLPFTFIAYGHLYTRHALLQELLQCYSSLFGNQTYTFCPYIQYLAEAIFAGFFISVYIGYVHLYNALDSEPDVLKSLYSPLLTSNSVEGLRYHEGGRLSDQQMALLQYQRENIHFLSEEILRLRGCLSKYGRSSDGSTPQVDLAHLLAARDQELRAVSAEMNQLQSELSLARSLISERDSELQRIQSINNQCVEENERLRAILGEWSTRAAKLERALEIERMSNLGLQKKLASIKSQTRESLEPS